MFDSFESNKKIIELLLPIAANSEPDEISRGKRRYTFSKKGQRVVYLLTDGDFFVKVREGNKIMSIVSAPLVTGFISYKDDKPLYLERVDYGKIKHVSYELFWQYVKEYDMLDDTMAVLASQYSDLMHHISLKRDTSGSEVRALIARWQTIPEHLKRRFSAMYLIENSSYLSKSSISRVLKDMREEGKLALDRGKFG